jgi:ABC-type sugar transport system ATPase subunit
MNTSDAAIPVRLRGVAKSFPGVTALRGVTLDILSGEAHALVGENGAGKSTLIKIIAGAYRPDEGSVEIFGRHVDDSDPRAHQKAGVSVLYQERSIVPDLPASANVFLGQTKRWGPFISGRATRRRFKELSERLSANIDPSSLAGSLSVANQQLLEIMRALDADHRILILDEPTTALGAPERRSLYAIVEDLRKHGLAIIFISHDLDEVLSVCDRVTVMRDGALVATKPVGEWSKQTLVDSMLGGAELRRTMTRRPPERHPVLTVKDLMIEGVIDGISFTLHKGEILGVAGLVGSGRTEILRALAGVDRGSRGQIEVNGLPLPWPRSVARALGYGIALAPEDRRQQGLVVGLNAVENVTLTNLGATSIGGFVNSRRQFRSAAAVMRDLTFNVSRLNSLTQTLSGGNQQKLVIGKWLYRRPSILLLDEPTQGIDIGAKAEIFNVIGELANSGTSIIFVSSEFEEVVEIADTVLVVGRGRALGMLDRTNASVKAILDLLFEAGGSLNGL